VALQCPTCGTRAVEDLFCRRCNTDLREMRAVERTAAWWRQRGAREVSRASGPEDMCKARAYAERACHLHRSRASLELLAVVALAEREFDLALRLWREIRCTDANAYRQTPHTRPDYRFRSRD